MEVHALAWAGLIVVVIGLITVDFVGHARNPHPPSIREAATWTVGYMALAALFGLGLLVFGGGEGQAVGYRPEGRAVEPHVDAPSRRVDEEAFICALDASRLDYGVEAFADFPPRNSRPV